MDLPSLKVFYFGNFNCRQVGIIIDADHPIRDFNAGEFRTGFLTDNISSVSIFLGENNVEKGLFLDDGGDVDTEVVSIGSPVTEARRTGNGQVLPSPDGNLVPDVFMQFRVADNAMFAGAPTTRVRIEVEYFDQGTDTFSIQYDALSGGPYGNGTFKDTGNVTKSNSQQFQIAVVQRVRCLFRQPGQWGQ